MSNACRYRFRGIDEAFAQPFRTTDTDGFVIAGEVAVESSQPQHSPAAIRSIADLNRFYRQFYSDPANAVR